MNAHHGGVPIILNSEYGKGNHLLVGQVSTVVYHTHLFHTIL